MFVIGRKRKGTADTPTESIYMAGTTGNVYTVKIDEKLSCTCPDNAGKSDPCKHIIYALINVLRVPDHLQYQSALLPSELRKIFANAPLPDEKQGADKGHTGKRKPVEGDCAICFTEFDAETESIVWCKAACGNNLHKQCFEQWAKSQRGNVVKCVYCRTPWQWDDGKNLKSILRSGEINEEGYVNVADELGLPSER
ncbi:MAG: hypothetical protein M1819_006575, partial [Sarea resinae]